MSVIHPDRDGIVWLGTDGGPVRLLDRRRGVATTFDYAAALGRAFDRGAAPEHGLAGNQRQRPHPL